MGKNKTKICYIIGLFVILFAILYLEFGGTRNYCGKLINKRIPYSTKILESYDTHGGFHGDGEFYIVFQFQNKQFRNFMKKVSKDNAWRKMPFSKEVMKISYWFDRGQKNRSYNIPSDNGIYYIRNLKENGQPLWDGYSVNFVIAILDLSNKRLYICREDS